MMRAETLAPISVSYQQQNRCASARVPQPVGRHRLRSAKWNFARNFIFARCVLKPAVCEIKLLYVLKMFVVVFRVVIPTFLQSVCTSTLLYILTHMAFICGFIYIWSCVLYYRFNVSRNFVVWCHVCEKLRYHLSLIYVPIPVNPVGFIFQLCLIKLLFISLLFDESVSKQINITIRIYRTIILPVFLCGCETWSLILREAHRLRVFQKRVLANSIKISIR
jgi:hypothetical protein